MEPVEVDPTTAEKTLDRGRELAQLTRRTSRWYARYLVIFAIMSFVIASLFGFVHTAAGSLVLTGVWVVFVLALTMWQQSKKTVVAGMNRLHLWVIGCWSAAWCLTLFVGVSFFRGQPPWWVAGGLLMALPPLVGAARVFRQTRT